MSTIGLTWHCEGIMTHRTTVVVWRRIHVGREAIATRCTLQWWNQVTNVARPCSRHTAPKVAKPNPHYAHSLPQQAQ